MHNFARTIICTFIGMWCWGAVVAAPAGKQVPLDPNLPFYRPVEKLSGELKLGGANTLSHVAAVWIAGFQEFYPEVNISIEVHGSRQAIADVQADKVDIGLLSRTIFPEEVKDFEKTTGYPPTVLTPCLERTAIYVHKENPIKGLTLAQLDAIYGTECKRGCEKPYRKWGQLGLKGKWSNLPITVHGRTMDTGSQVFMQEAVLLGSSIRDDVLQHKSNVDMLNAVAQEPGGVGFGGLSYATSDVRPVPLAFAEGQEFVAIDSPEADQGHYPLIRRLEIVVQYDPQKQLQPVNREFIKYVFSRLGQEDVVKAGFQPIPARPARVALDAVGQGLAR